MYAPSTHLLQPTYWTEARLRAFMGNARREIGRGGYGIVFVNDTVAPGIVCKASRDRPQQCLDFGHELDVYTRIVEKGKIDVLPIRTVPIITVIQRVSLPALESRYGVEPVLYCVLVAQRVYRPSEIGARNGAIDLAVHQYLGADTATGSGVVGQYAGRGVYLTAERSLAVLHVTNPFSLTMNGLAHALGMFVGVLHYGARIDANDMEYILGSTRFSEDGHRYVYAIDFDKVRWLSPEIPTDPVAIRQEADQLATVLDNEPYFPVPGQEHYAAFKAGYLRGASNTGGRQARQVANAVSMDREAV